MSSPDRRAKAGPIAAAVLAATLAACTEFRPMYADPAVLGVAAPNLERALGRVRIAPIEGRAGVELRNNLIFELTGGGVEPTAYDYELTVTVSSSAGNLSIEAITGRPTSAQLAMIARYRRTRAGSPSTVVGTGSFTTRVPYDQTVQRFANIRARRDAEDRGARELAVLIRNGVAALITQPQTIPPASVPAPAIAAPPLPTASATPRR